MTDNENYEVDDLRRALEHAEFAKEVLHARLSSVLMENADLLATVRQLQNALLSLQNPTEHAPIGPDAAPPV